MRRTAILVPLLAVLAVAACQTMPLGDEVRLTKLVVSDNLRDGIPYTVTMPYQTTGGNRFSVRKACFTWSGEGPYCFPVRDDPNVKEFSARLHTGSRGSYNLRGYVEYLVFGEKKRSNTVGTMIVV